MRHSPSHFISIKFSSSYDKRIRWIEFLSSIDGDSYRFKVSKKNWDMNSDICGDSSYAEETHSDGNTMCWLVK